MAYVIYQQRTIKNRDSKLFGFRINVDGTQLVLTNLNLVDNTRGAQFYFQFITNSY